MIKKWREFEHQVRLRGMPLLKRLDDFPDAILVAGCQRSGTTMLAKIVAQSDGVHDFKLGAADANLDAGLILSGAVEHEPAGPRYCFQTTHVDERYREYLEHAGNFRMIWCLRNPLSVVYSLVYNWPRWALRSTFTRCGAERLEITGAQRGLYRLLGDSVIGRVHKGCMVYNAKVAQIFALAERLRCRGLVVVEYDDLVRRKTEILPKLYDFLGLEYRAVYADKILASSLDKAKRLSRRETDTVMKLSAPIYERAKAEFWEGTAARPGSSLRSL